MDSLVVRDGVTAAATTEWISSSLSPNLPASLNKRSINLFDRSMMFSYSSTLDIASDITQYSTIMYPLLLAIDVDASEYWTIGVLYVDALTISFSVKNGLKLPFPRYRPYMYYPNPPERLFPKRITRTLSLLAIARWPLRGQPFLPTCMAYTIQIPLGGFRFPWLPMVLQLLRRFFRLPVGAISYPMFLWKP